MEWNPIYLCTLWKTLYPIMLFNQTMIDNHFPHSSPTTRFCRLKWHLQFLWYIPFHLKNTKWIDQQNTSCQVSFKVWRTLFLQLYMNCGNTTSFGMWLRIRTLCYLTWMERMLVCLYLRINPWTVVLRNRISVDHSRKVSFCSHSLNAPS